MYLCYNFTSFKSGIPFIRTSLLFSRSVKFQPWFLVESSLVPMRKRLGFYEFQGYFLRESNHVSLKNYSLYLMT